jgi:hypothetical protein
MWNEVHNVYKNSWQVSPKHISHLRMMYFHSKQVTFLHIMYSSQYLQFSTQNMWRIKISALYLPQVLTFGHKFWIYFISTNMPWTCFPVKGETSWHEDTWESGDIDPLILNLGTRYRWVVSFIPRPLYLKGNFPSYPVFRRLGRSQSRSGNFGEEDKLLALPGIKPPLPDYPACSLVAILTELLQLCPVYC